MCRLRHGHAGGGGGLADARSIAEPVVNSARLVLCGSQADDYSPRQPGCVCCARYHVRRAMAVWNPAWAKNIKKSDVPALACNEISFFGADFFLEIWSDSDLKIHLLISMAQTAMFESQWLSQ